MMDRLLVAAVLIGVWQALSLAYGSFWIPSPLDTLARLVADLNGEIPRHAAYTASEVVFGFIVGGAPAVTLPFLLRRHPITAAILEPFITAGYGVPKLAVTPLFILWFGVGMAPKVALVAISVFFILYVNTLAGVRAIDPRLLQMARVAGASERTVARHIVLPAATPHIFAGLTLALPYSIGGAVVAELLSANRGLGYLVQRSATGFDTVGVYVGLIAVGTLVLAGIWTMTRVERHILPWRLVVHREVL